MIGRFLRPCVTSLGSRGDPSPSTICPQRESVQGGYNEAGEKVGVLCVLLCHIMNEFEYNDCTLHTLRLPFSPPYIAFTVTKVGG